MIFFLPNNPSISRSFYVSQLIINQLINPQNTVLFAGVGTFCQSSCMRVSIIVHYVAVGITSHVINSPSALKLTRCVSNFFAYSTAHYVPYDKYALPGNRNYKCLLVRYISNMWVCLPAATCACTGCPETITFAFICLYYFISVELIFSQIIAAIEWKNFFIS